MSQKEDGGGVTPVQAERTIENLRARARELQNRLDAIHRDYRQGLHADSEERAQELENAEVLNEIERVTVESLQAVKQQIAELTEA